MVYRKEFGKVFLIGVSLVSGAALTFLSQIIFARTLSAEEFGSLIAAFAIIRTLSPVASFGISEYWLARFGVDGWGALSLLMPSMRALATTVVFSIVLGVLWAWFGASNNSTTIAIIYVLPMIVFQALSSLVVSRYQLEERYRNISYWAALPHVPRAAVAVLAILLHLSLVEVLAGLSGIYILLCVVPLVVLFGMHGDKFKLVGHGKRSVEPFNVVPMSSWEVLSGAKWFGLSGAFYLLHYQGMIILLEAFSGRGEAANYGVAYTILAAVFIIPTVIYRWYMMPKMHRWASSDIGKLYGVYRRTLPMLLLVALSVAILLWFFAPLIIVTFFGERYISGIEILQWLSVAIFFRFLSVAQGALLVSLGQVRIKVLLDVCCAVIALVSGIILINLYGVMGGVFATGIAEVSLVFMYSGKLFRVRNNALIS